MLRIPATVLVVSIFMGSTGSVWAAESNHPQDEIDIQSCLEGVREYNASNPDENPASRNECIGAVANPCLREPQGESTIGMVECHDREARVWDGLLNAHYSALGEALEKAAFKALRDTQRKWIAYRDAKCGWPSAFFEGGSIARPIGAACINEETARRTNDLADYLDWMNN